MPKNSKCIEMNNLPLVTIGVPAYKAQFLAEALESLVNQTYANIKLLVVDDCSPEDLNAVVERFRTGHKIEYVRNEINLGGGDLCRNWNKCLELAQGEFFILAADDDVYDTRFVELMVEITVQYPDADLFHSRISKINEQGETLSYSEACFPFETAAEFIHFRLERRRHQQISDFMFRSQKLKAAGGFVSFPCGWHSDDATTFILSLNGVAWRPEVLFHWRTSDVNLSSRKDLALEKIKGSFQFLDWMGNLLPKLTPHSAVDTLFLASIKRNANESILRQVNMDLAIGGVGALVRFIIMKKPRGVSARFYFKLALAKLRRLVR